MLALAPVAVAGGRLAAQGAASAPAGADPQPIQRMAATERAFAAAAAEIGSRDAFLTFFAPDAIQIEAGSTGAAARIGPARPALVARPLAKLPLATRLMWEPFTGQVSADGTLGWLTGAYVNLALATKDILAQGAYFSVWQREDDGTWRVWLDEGIRLPDVWRDAAPFRAAAEPDAGTAGAADEPLDRAERAVADWGAGWRARLSADVRLHRQDVMPVVGRDAVIAWEPRAWTRASATLVTTRVAASGDLGVAIGGYDAAAASGRPEHGTWLRVWKRDVTGRWRIVFESSKSNGVRS